jgi:hypothetical protein
MGDAEFKRVFEASPATRRSEWATVIIYSFLLCLIVGTAGFCTVDVALDIDLRRMTPWWLLVAGAPLVISLIVGYLWSRSRCRFVLALNETDVQAGPLCISYEDVEQVDYYVGYFDEIWASTAIEITGGGKRICVRIDHSERAECVKLLEQRCRNAMIVSGSGDEYLPKAPIDKIRVARMALARFRQRAWGFLYGTVASGALGGFFLYALSVRAMNDILILTWVMCILGVVGVPVGVWMAIVYFKKARLMREFLTNLENQSGEKLES